MNLTTGQTLTLDQNGAPDGSLSIATGTFDLSTFTVNSSAAGATLTVSNRATLKIGGTNSFPANYTRHTLGTSSTVEYSGTAQTVSAETYGDLTLSGSGVKTLTSVTTINGNLTLSGMATATTAAALTIGGNLDAGSGTTFTVAGFTIGVTGTTSVSGTLTHKCDGYQDLHGQCHDQQRSRHLSSTNR